MAAFPNTLYLRSRYGQVGHGIEHEGLIDKRWTGYLHFFQLWVNLPRASKHEAPNFQNAVAASLPVAAIANVGTAKVLVGADVFGVTSPVKSAYVPMQYVDFEIDAGAELTHESPPSLSTRFVWVYRGSLTIEGTTGSEGQLMVLSRPEAGHQDTLVVTAGAEGCGFMFAAGQPIGEPVVQHGPFVMNTRQDIQTCFEDYQRGQLTNMPVTRTHITTPYASGAGSKAGEL